MKLILTTLSFLFVLSAANAQYILRLKKGNSYYKNKQYKEAIKEYEGLMGTSKGIELMGVDAKLHLADCYRMNEQPFKANELFESLISNAEDNPEMYILYGKALMDIGKWDKALEQFQDYNASVPNNGKTAALIARCEEIQQIEPLFNEVDFTFQQQVNDSFSNQYAPVYFGGSIVFTSDQQVQGQEGVLNNLYQSQVNDQENMQASEAFSQFNEVGRDDGPACFSRDGKMIIYAQSVMPTATAINPTVYQQLVWSKLEENGEWSQPEVLPFVIPGKNFTHPTLSPDGETLYFASDMNGGFGGMDIWMSKFENEHWRTPQNVGEQINTEKDDAYPYAHPSGLFFYASKGMSGYGGYDLFRTMPLGNGVEWIESQNMGKPFNSALNDVSLILSDDQTRGYMSSNRERYYNLYHFVLVGEEPQPLPGGTDDLNAPEVNNEPNNHDQDVLVEVEGRDNRLNNSTVEENAVVENTVEGGTEIEVETISSTDELALEISFINESNQSGLKGVRVQLTNTMTGGVEEYKADRRGQLKLPLEVGNKYMLRATKSGYFGSNMPISTMNVTEMEIKKVKFPLYKK